MQNFFERTSSAPDDKRLCIGNLTFTVGDFIKLMQITIIKREALRAESRYQDILDKAKKKFSKTLANSLETIIGPIFKKCIQFFCLLISMEDGNPQLKVDLAEVEASLIAIDLEAKVLFKKYANTIYILQGALVPFLQTFLEDKRTKVSLAIAFKEQSVKPLLYQMMINEYETFGIPVSLPNNNDSKLNNVEDGVLKETIEKIYTTEVAIAQTQDQNEFPYLRDLAYLRSLKDNEFYLVNGKGPSSISYRLADLDNERLVKLIQEITQVPVEDSFRNGEINARQQQSNLQLLAILHQLYFNLYHSYLNEQELASILLAWSQSKIALQWQLDVQRVSAPALLLYVSMLCLHGEVVHIEQASQLLGLNQTAEITSSFLQLLKIVYIEYHHPLTDKLGVLHLQTSKEDPKTYYFGSQVIQFSSHPAVNNYLAHALLEFKQQILQPFDAWYSVLNRDGYQLEMGQNRENLLEIVEKLWAWRVQHHTPYHNLKQIDTMIERFQQQDLPRIWQSMEKKLWAACATQQFSALTRRKIEFLQTQSEKIYANLSLKQHKPTSILPVLSTEEAEKYLLSARLYYEHHFWSDASRKEWIQTYLKRKMIRLQRICPEVIQVSDITEQFKLFIQYFYEKARSQQLSAELVSAVQASMHIYGVIEMILPGAREEEISAKIQYLTTITNASAIKILAQTVMTKLNWVTDTDSFYYQWFESAIVKQAAGRMYEAAEKLSAYPDNSRALQNFLVTLIEQQHRLAQRWYFPWAWFWGYQDIRTVLNETIQQVRVMIALQQIPLAQFHAAEEAGRCAIVLQKLHTEIRRAKIEPTKLMAWNAMVKNMKTIQKSYTGVAMLYELRAYLQTQEQKFMLKSYSSFFGPRYVDQTDALCRVLDQSLEKMGQSEQKALANPAFLRHKAQQIQKQNPDISKVYIQAGYCESQYFDMWIHSEMPIQDFQEDTKHRWYKRFYHAKDLLVFSQAGLVVQNDGDMLNLSFV